VKLRELAESPPAQSPRDAALDRYAALFNARDWEGVRAMIAQDCRLDLVGKSQRRGKAVGAYFSRYEREAVRLEVGTLEGRPALAAFTANAPAPAYFILLDIADGKVESIRDFRYTPYIAADADGRPL
jgi:RNA polymerase sigma-70 factor (ECF subfamily)